MNVKIIIFLSRNPLFKNTILPDLKIYSDVEKYTKHKSNVNRECL